MPLHDTTVVALRTYATERDRFCPAPSSAAFFVSSAGTPLNRSDVAKTLRRITTAMGLRSTAVRPTAHQLRHSLAVRTLIGWHRSGVTIDERIAALSIFLGHVSPADTYWYLSAAPELMALAAERLDSRFRSTT